MIIIIISYLRFAEIGMIKAQIRAAETVTRIKEESVKQQREREREATCAALQQVTLI